MIISAILLLIYDYECTASGLPGDSIVREEYGIPKQIFVICAVLLFLAYNLGKLHYITYVPYTK